jgi:KipI family sensor histidine kinase inhibitor
VRIRRCGERGALVEADGPVLPLLEAARAARLGGLVELVPGDRTLLVVAQSPADLAALVGDLRTLDPQATTPEEAAELVVTVDYGGPDLETIAQAWGVDVTEVVRRHTTASWQVAFTGFSPGFGYLRSEADWPSVARRDSPRTRVPAGSVALAGPYSGVYPSDSPGGWQLIGSTVLDLFDPDRDPPALMWPGRRVRFETTESP